MKTIAVASLLLVAALDSVDSLPNQPNGHVWGCLPNNVSSTFPFCDDTLPISERLLDLVNRLTLEEKIGLMSADSATHVNACNEMDHGVPRFGIPPYMHLVETNTAVASSCLKADKCSTNYPGPTGLGASFNRSLWYEKGHAMGEEMRAFNNLNWYRGMGPQALIGLNGYGPNLNIARDPRYGRTSELVGEDPYLTGQYAIHMVRGGQSTDEMESGKSKYFKMTMGLKHFALYGVEVDRASFIPNVTAHDLWETFLPQYAAGFSKVDADGNSAGGAMGTMCSYAGLNGVPSCGNDYLLNRVIREKFQRPDVVVGTDCGAVNNMVNQNHFASSGVDASAKTLQGGTDMELGDQYWSPKSNGGLGLLEEALIDRKVSKSRIDTSVKRIMNLRMITGQFDSLKKQPYSLIGEEAVNSTSAQQLNLEAALQSFVLLKNDNNILPLQRGKKTALLGPHVNSKRDLMSDYKGDEQCVGGGSDFSCFPSIAEQFVALNPTTTVVEQGVDMDSNVTSGIAPALQAAAAAEQVMLFIGIGNGQEHEAHDRFNISLPGLQESFTLQVLALCKQHNIPVAVVLINGGAVAIDPIVPVADAIVEAFYPSVRGPLALNRALFGDENRFGRLPVTIYNKNYTSEVDFHSFDMSKSPGRTYKYFTGTPLFEFGSGMTYSKMSMKCNTTAASGVSMKIECQVTNLKESPSGDEVLMVYHSVSDAIRSAAKHPVPMKELIDFERVTVAKDETATVSFTVGENQLGMVDENGDRQLIAGDHTVIISNGNVNHQVFVIKVVENKVLDVVPKF